MALLEPENTIRLQSVRSAKLVRSLDEKLAGMNARGIDAKDAIRRVNALLGQYAPAFGFLDKKQAYFAALSEGCGLTIIYPRPRILKFSEQSVCNPEFAPLIVKFDEVHQLIAKCRFAALISEGEYHKQIRGLEGSMFYACSRVFKKAQSEQDGGNPTSQPQKVEP